VRRREFIFLFGGAAAMFPRCLSAQLVRKIPIIGFLHPGFSEQATGPSQAINHLRDGLTEIGYTEGQTIEIQARWGRGRPETLVGLAEDLVRLRVDILVTVARPSIEAAKAATKDLPIIAVDLESDPVASGFVSSLAAPGGNLTGLFLDLPGLSAKWLQLVREVVPQARRIGVLWDISTGPSQLDAIRIAAKAIPIDLQILEFRDAAGMEDALSTGLKAQPDALIQLGSPLINQAADRVVKFSTERHLPAISPFRSFVEAGGMMSYGPNLPIMFRRALPSYVSKILLGAKPADLPVEEPTNFELVVNLKTARELGITIPPAVFARATEVIE
jgi:putative ABC transport system substrate-binding protein